MANGDALIIGQMNRAEGRTVLRLTRGDGPVLDLGSEGGNTTVRAGSVGAAGVGMHGGAHEGTGVLGTSAGRIGVRGMTEQRRFPMAYRGTPPPAPAAPQAGVLGNAMATVGVCGISQSGSGVEGRSERGSGVKGTSGSGAGVSGSTTGSDLSTRGIEGIATATTGGGVGVFGQARNGYAGFFAGDVTVFGGDFQVVGGTKSAVVPHPDGSHRVLYALECPESWFEDFGSARLVRGRATVRLDRDFAAVVRTGPFHVFITPEGDCRGLFVARKSRTDFEVRELQGGRSSIRFSYRVVGGRRDVAVRRLPRLRLSKQERQLAEAMNASRRRKRRRR